jgi:hypothetical protein
MELIWPVTSWPFNLVECHCVIMIIIDTYIHPTSRFNTHYDIYAKFYRGSAESLNSPAMRAMRLPNFGSPA